MIWLEIMSDVLFWISNKSFVAFLNRYAHISYKYFEVGKIKIKFLTAMITTHSVEKPAGLPYSRFSPQDESRGWSAVFESRGTLRLIEYAPCSGKRYSRRRIRCR
jgi:hypothetical protein